MQDARLNSAPAGAARRPLTIPRRTIGKAMIAVGVVGILAGIGAVIVGQSLVRQVETSVDDSLVVTTKALAAVNDSIALTGTIVDTIRAGVESAGATIASVRTSIDQSSTAISDTGDFLGGSLPDSISAVSDVLPTIEKVASTIDSTLRALSRAPFGPNYDPEKPFDEAIAELSTAIEPLPEQLRTLSSDFADLNTSTDGISTGLATLGDDIVDLQTQLDDVSTLIDRYAATAGEAATLAASSRRNLHDSASSTRLLLIVLGLVFIAGQIVPIWLGTVLLGEQSIHTVIARRHSGTNDNAPPDKATPPDGAETEPVPQMRSPNAGDRIEG